jgi:hypothetical protein
MKKADNFDSTKWLTENKITTQSRLNEEETLTPSQKSAATRAQNKKRDIESKAKMDDKRKATAQEEQERRTSNKLPKDIGMYWYGGKTKQYLGDLAQYYFEYLPMQGPGSDGSTDLKLKPEFVDQSFNNAQVAWDVYDRKVNN